MADTMVPPTPEQRTQPAPAVQPQANVPQTTGPVQTDERQINEELANDPRWTLLLDSLTGGLIPWLKAGVMTGFDIDDPQFEELRQRFSADIEQIKQQNPELVQAIDKSKPIIAGIIGGGLGRGGSAIAGGLVGATQGFTGGPSEEPSFSEERVGEALEGGVEGAILGSVGRKVFETARAAPGKVRKMSQERTQRREAEAAATEKKAVAELRKQLTQRPQEMFHEMAEKGMTPEQMARRLNMKPETLAKRMLKTAPRAKSGGPNYSPEETTLIRALHRLLPKDAKRPTMQEGPAPGSGSRGRPPPRSGQ